jgi:asparagine synthetase B (glutamine-hydrolysing)
VHRRPDDHAYLSDGPKDLVFASELGPLPELVRHYAEPFAHSSALPTWYLCQHTRSGVTVALSGDGADEPLLLRHRRAEPRGNQIWSLMMLELWFHAFIDR